MNEGFEDEPPLIHSGPMPIGLESVKKSIQQPRDGRPFAVSGSGASWLDSNSPAKERLQHIRDPKNGYVLGDWMEPSSLIAYQISRYLLSERRADHGLRRLSRVDDDFSVQQHRAHTRTSADTFSFPCRPSHKIGDRISELRDSNQKKKRRSLWNGGGSGAGGGFGVESESYIHRESQLE